MNNNPTTLISFLGTEPSFKSDLPVKNAEENKVFIKELSQDLVAAQNFSPLLQKYEEELKFISKSADHTEKLDKVITMISDEMGLTINGVNPNMSLEDRFEHKNKTSSPSIPSPTKVFKPTL